MSGPYETERDAAQALVVTSTRDLDGAATQAAIHRQLVEACAAHGVEVGSFDRRVLYWLASWEPTMAAVVIGLISRAHAAGKTGGDGKPALVEHPSTGDYDEAMVQRCRWARVHGISPAWSHAEQLTVALVLGDAEALRARGCTLPEAITRVRPGMPNPPADMPAWLRSIRARAEGDES